MDHPSSLLHGLAGPLFAWTTPLLVSTVLPPGGFAIRCRYPLHHPYICPCFWRKHFYTPLLEKFALFIITHSSISFDLLSIMCQCLQWYFPYLPMDAQFRPPSFFLALLRCIAHLVKDVLAQSVSVMPSVLLCGLLLQAGDVEVNPGPTQGNERAPSGQQLCTVSGNMMCKQLYYCSMGYNYT